MRIVTNIIKKTWKGINKKINYLENPILYDCICDTTTCERKRHVQNGWYWKY